MRAALAWGVEVMEHESVGWDEDRAHGWHLMEAEYLVGRVLALRAALSHEREQSRSLGQWLPLSHAWEQSSSKGLWW